MLSIRKKLQKLYSFLSDLHKEDLSPEMLALKFCCQKGMRGRVRVRASLRSVSKSAEILLAPLYKASVTENAHIVHDFFPLFWKVMEFSIIWTILANSICLATGQAIPGFVLQFCIHPFEFEFSSAHVVENLQQKICNE